MSKFEKMIENKKSNKSKMENIIRVKDIGSCKDNKIVFNPKTNFSWKLFGC